MIVFVKQFSQGISVAICAAMSAGTLGYMMCDVYKMEKKQIAMDYEKQIKVLNEEIEKLRLEKAKLKLLN
jgi:ABC-type phosphate transport system auxiliary subunit